MHATTANSESNAKMSKKFQNSSDLILIVLCISAILCQVIQGSRAVDSGEIHYNLPDPECTGPFGLCTQEDKDRLGYLSIKKLHEKMDDDRDGHVEIQETKEFMAEELQYKTSTQEKEEKFHGTDTDISVEELWKAWKYSEVYNWTTDNLVVWINDHVKLPQYADYFRRNRIDGQFLPRLALNENNYYANVMQIKDSRHKRLIMIKATDLVLFGYHQKPHNLIKDVLMISSLTLSIFVCIYLYSKHRQSLEQIKQMINDFEKLAELDVINKLHSSQQLQNQQNNDSWDLSSNLFQKRNSTGEIFNFNFLRSQQKENKLMSEKNSKLSLELNLAKKEAEQLKRERESTVGQLKQLELALRELEKVRAALRQTETKLEIIKFQAPSLLFNMLKRSFESEKELFDYKHKIIEKEKSLCSNELNKLSKRQTGVFGAFKLVHSSYIEELNHRIDLIKHDSEKLKSQKNESLKRWDNIWTILEDLGKVTEPVNGMINGILPANSTESFASSSTHQSDQSQQAKSHDSSQEKNSIKKQSTTVIDESRISINDNLAFNTISTIINKKNYQSKSILSINNNDNSNNTNQVNIDQSALVLRNSIKNETHNLKLDQTSKHTNGHSSTNNLENQNSKQSATSLNSPTSLNTPQIITSHHGSQKIARDSLIHKIDVFQFDDVDSVHTHDSLFLPHSSMESNEIDEYTYRSYSIDLDPNNNTHSNVVNSKKKAKKQSDKNRDSMKSKLLANLITPLIRNNSTRVNASKTSANKESLQASVSSKGLVGMPLNDEANELIGTLSVQRIDESSPVLVERSGLQKTSSFSRHLNSLKRLIAPSNGQSHEPKSVSNLNLHTAETESTRKDSSNVVHIKTNSLDREEKVEKNGKLEPTSNKTNNGSQNNDEIKINGTKNNFLKLKFSNRKNKTNKVKNND